MRVDHSFNNQIEEQLSKLEQKIDSKRGGGGRCCGCFSFLVVLVLAIISLGMYVGAKAGFIEIPYVNHYIYKRPQPSYLVTASDVSQSTLIEQLKKKSVVALLTKQSVEVPLVISDAYLSSVLRSTIETQNKKVELAQVAVLERYLEVYVANGDMVVTMGVVPTLVEGKVKLEVEFVRLGNLNLPKSVGGLALRLVLGNVVNGLTTGLKFFGDIKEVKLVDEGLEIL
ncbi:hypothetical protein IT409_01295, partial [Candidatus Falkowbacteria bacterium]|nr:hypothetical protein [Candidatus Falkowbacteria bacterium]